MRMWWNGRHACLRGKWEIVWVQVPPSAPNANCRAFSSIFCLYKKCSALMPAICLLPTKREIVLQFRSVLSCEVVSTKIYNRKNYLVAGLERSVKKMCQWHIFSDWRESEHRPATNTCKAEQVPPSAPRKKESAYGSLSFFLRML